MSLANMTDSVATVLRPTVGQDVNQGTTLDPFVVVAANLPCSTQQAGASVRQVYGQRQVSVTTVLYFEDNPGTQVNDVIDVVDQLGNSWRFLVHGGHPPLGRWAPWQVDCELLQEPA